MALVVWCVYIFPIPASREEDLSAQTARAIEIGHIVCLGEVGTTEAGIGNGVRGRIVAIAASGCVTGNHTEAFWKGLEFLFLIITSALEIVHCHAAMNVFWVSDSGDWHERPIPELDVQLGCPVVRHVFLEEIRGKAS